MRFFYFILLIVLPFSFSSAEDSEEIFLGINTADVREDTSSVQFLNLFSSAIPFKETVPWGSKKEVTYDENGWPDNLNGGQAGTKFLNRLPEDTVEDGFFTVLYDGEGEIFYGNDARLVVHRPNKDIIEIKAGKDKILNASLFVRKSNPENYLRNIRILPEGGICKGAEHQRVKSPADCVGAEYLSFEDNHLNPWAKEQREKLAQEIQKNEEEAEQTKKETGNVKEKLATKDDDKKVGTLENSKEDQKNDVVKEEVKEASKDEGTKTIEDDQKTEPGKKKEVTVEKVDKDAFVIKGYSDPKKALMFNPEYLNFMKDFQMVRFMNMSGMTRNPVVDWDKRNTLKKATWGGKYGSRGAPVEIMVALSNQLDAYPWFSMPYKASDDYIKQFGEYVKEHLEPELKTYIEYSNEVWNPIFIHHDYAIKQGMKEKLDKKKSQAGYKWFSKRSVKTFKLWEEVFGGNERLIRVMGGWVSNQILSNTLLSYKDAYKHTDALAIGPYFSALPRVLRRTKTVDDVFKAMLDKKTKEGMESTVNYIKKQIKVTDSFGVDLVAYEGGQHLVDWNTRKVDEHPNKLLYAANRDPRMGILYDELMNEWYRAGGKLFVAFSAPRIYSWYGSWGIKEHIRQPRSDAPKYDSLLRYLSARLYPKQLPQPGINPEEISEMGGEVKNVKIGYAKTPQMIWNMNHPQQIKSNLKNNNARDIDAHWQANWDTKNLYMNFAINDDDIQAGDEIIMTLDTTTATEDLAKEKAQIKLDIENEKALIEKQKKEKAARKLKYERIAREKKEKAEALAKEKEEADKAKLEGEKEVTKTSDSKDKKSDKNPIEKEVKIVKKEDKKSGDKKLELKNNKVSDTIKMASKSATDKIIEAMKQAASKDVKSDSKNNEGSITVTDKELISKQIKATESTDEKESGLKKLIVENVITFTFTPFDELNNQSRITLSDSGYLINVTIPWSEIYHDKDMIEIQMKSGDQLGVNIIVKDYDKDEKGNKELVSADTNLPLPKLVLKNILID